MTDWVRLWHDMPTDPKWRVIARKSGQPLPCVIAVFNMMLVSASQNADDRGTLLGWEDEDVAAALDMDTDDVSAIRSAMDGKVLDGDRLTGWDRRQPKREDNSADRVRAHRERKATQGNAQKRAVPKVKRDVTQRNAPEKIREETDNNPPTPQGAGVPDWIPDEEWESYERMRKQIRKPLTPEAAKLAILELGKLRDEGHQPVDVLNQSILNSWQGLFPLKARSRASPEPVVGI